MVPVMISRRFLLSLPMALAAQPPAFLWPEGKRAALSLSFDDARLSQVDAGVPFLNERGVKATFYVLSSIYSKRLEAWKAAHAAGHEIAHHTKAHPCSINFNFARKNALENLTLEQLAQDLDTATDEIQSTFGIKPESFAYPCGQKFVGRGSGTQSYVPLIAKRFITGRGYMDEAANDPSVCDLSSLTGIGFDNLTFAQMKTHVDAAVREGRWLIFAGHEMGTTNGRQMTDLGALGHLIDYVRKPEHGLWVDTVGHIGRYVHSKRG